MTVSHPDPNLDDTDLPPWFETGLTCRVNHAIYRYFREIAMPKVQGESWFIAGRNAGPLRLFWESGDDCFARELTNEETRRFGELTGVVIADPERLAEIGEDRIAVILAELDNGIFAFLRIEFAVRVETLVSEGEFLLCAVLLPTDPKLHRKMGVIAAVWTPDMKEGVAC